MLFKPPLVSEIQVPILSAAGISLYFIIFSYAAPPYPFSPFTRPLSRPGR